jgi:wobble nucleotide-excising tRNase
MMIKNISHIKNLGVFNDFEWKSEVRSNGGSVQNFVDINIIYGRNYSGKTTLSRIIRALETGTLSDKYGAPSFKLKFTDNSEVEHTSLSNNGKIIRVFNEDFIRDNLRFITNPDDSIEPFAILGDDNNRIEEEIKILEKQLGSNIKDQETGLFAEQKKAEIAYNNASNTYNQSNKNLENQLNSKATNKNTGIKYKPERFGDQNYNIKKLNADITEVSTSNFQPLNSEQVTEYEKLIIEKVLPAIPRFKQPKLNFIELAEQVKILMTKSIGESNKIQALVKDAVLNRWVNDGRNHHRNKHKKCAFCDNEISSKRWAELDKHFDEESELLEKSIDTLLTNIEVEKKTICSALAIDKTIFYSKFHSQLIDLESKLTAAVKNYQNNLDNLANQLRSRKDDILNAKDYVNPYHIDCTETLEQIWKKYSGLCDQSESFSSSLTDEQNKAKTALRLKEVADYLIAIDYQRQRNEIETLEGEKNKAQKQKEYIDENITKIQALITTKKRELNDEEKGAKKVNEYLNNFFGHQFLTLEAKKDEGITPDSKRIRFEVIRDGKKAYHLSEGECRLLAFCYFLFVSHHKK